MKFTKRVQRFFNTDCIENVVVLHEIKKGDTFAYNTNMFIMFNNGTIDLLEDITITKNNIHLYKYA